MPPNNGQNSGFDWGSMAGALIPAAVGALTAPRGRIGMGAAHGLARGLARPEEDRIANEKRAMEERRLQIDEQQADIEAKNHEMKLRDAQRKYRNQGFVDQYFAGIPDEKERLKERMIRDADPELWAKGLVNREMDPVDRVGIFKVLTEVFKMDPTEAGLFTKGPMEEVRKRYNEVSIAWAKKGPTRVQNKRSGEMLSIDRYGNKKVSKTGLRPSIPGPEKLKIEGILEDRYLRKNLSELEFMRHKSGFGGPEISKQINEFSLWYTSPEGQAWYNHYAHGEPRPPGPDAPKAEEKGKAAPKTYEEWLKSKALK